MKDSSIQNAKGNLLPLSSWVPISRKEVEQRGWDTLDVIIVSGDAYVDHPSFGAAVIARTLEAGGYRVAILPQPNWRDDLRDFKKLGAPRLFFGVSAGSMDSMVNHYTAQKRLRSDDAYTPGGKAGFRPDYPTLVYSRILKDLFPDVPVVVGGIEASLRRIAHYDYWQDKLKPSILTESGADLLLYGMGEKSILSVADRLAQTGDITDCHSLPQVSYLQKEKSAYSENKSYQSDLPDIILAPFETCVQSKRAQARNFALVEDASNQWSCGRILQQTGDATVIINPPYPISFDQKNEIDAAFDLPYTRLPHPRYKNRGEIPAYTMIRHSINIHRGCFGGCAFCTISAHQGKQIQSRSESSILKELEKVVEMEDFKGYISDLGGPSANMYNMRGKDADLCRKCHRPSCVFPSICRNLNHDHATLTALYKKVSSHPKIKKCFIGSGIRYDLLVPYLKSNENHAQEYALEVIKNGVSGRLKVAPEHTEDGVLKIMRKMPFEQFKVFKSFFENANRQFGLNQQLIPYFIASHPGCTQADMQSLANKTKALGYKLEQVQNFTPTPMTLASEMFYTGLNPHTLEKVYVPKQAKEREEQLNCFFWYKKDVSKNYKKRR